MLFDDWGTEKNPITQADMSDLFGGYFSCMKKFYLKASSEDVHKKSYHLAFGEALRAEINTAIRNRFREGQLDIEERIIKIENKVKVIYSGESRSDLIDHYQGIADLLVANKAFQQLRKLKDYNERFTDMGFIMKVGDHFVAGSMDVIVSKKNGITVITWKTRKNVESQYEMDHNYQSIINFFAIKNGVFFPAPKDGVDGQAYSRAYKDMWDEETRFDVYPKILIGHLQDLIPLKKKVKKKPKHKSSERLANSDGDIVLEAGDQRGPIYYEANIGKIGTAWNRLLHSVDAATKMAQNGVFPETWGPNCEKCFYRNQCETLGGVTQTDQADLLSIMRECQIDPEKQ